MPDPIFTDPRLAALYDVFEGDRDDLVPYVDIVEELAARTVLDVGCGTGTLAVELARRGVEVLALDPAVASLEIARRKAGADAVTWLEGDIESVPSLAVDLAVMTGNVAQVFLGEKEWQRTLLRISSFLRPDGHLVFETRRLERRIWEDWGRGFEEHVERVPGRGLVRQRREVTAVDLPFVTFRLTYTFEAGGPVVVSDSTLRFRSREEIEQSLTATGFRTVAVRDAPDRPGHEYVFIARRI